MPGVEPGSVSTSAEDSFTGLVSVYQNSVQTVFAVFFDLTSALVSEYIRCLISSGLLGTASGYFLFLGRTDP